MSGKFHVPRVRNSRFEFLNNLNALLFHVINLIVMVLKLRENYKKSIYHEFWSNAASGILKVQFKKNPLWFCFKLLFLLIFVFLN